MHLTIQQLLQNHTRGINSLPYQEGEYLGDIEVPKITDLNDVAENRNKLKDELEALNEVIQDEMKAKQPPEEPEPPKEPETPAEPPKKAPADLPD